MVYALHIAIIIFPSVDEVDEFKWGVGEGDNYVLKSVFLTLYTSESDVCRRQILTYNGKS